MLDENELYQLLPSIEDMVLGVQGKLQGYMILHKNRSTNKIGQQMIATNQQNGNPRRKVRNCFLISFLGKYLGH